MTPIRFVKGHTGDIRFNLHEDGTQVNLTGKTVEPLLMTSSDAIVGNPGSCSISNAPAGAGTWNPDAELQVGSYRLRFKVTDQGKVYYYPSGEAHAVEVQKL